MSTAAAAPAQRPAPTTYAQLTHKASCTMARASLAISATGDPEPRDAAGPEVAAVRDVAAALAHLGSTLQSSSAGGSGGKPTRSRGTDARLLAGLRAVADPRDWESTRPRVGPAADLDRAAVLIRTAADLWSTHLAADGRGRSPEAARMRHPATRGAATREWRCLVTLAAEVADRVASGRSAADPGSDALRALTAFPRPAEVRHPAGGDGHLLHFTVARPGLTAGQPPLVELAERVRRLRHLAWRHARSGDAPAVVHVTLARIGVAIHRAAAAAHEAAALTAPDGPVRQQHRAARDRARRGRSTWQAVADHVRYLRTPHPTTHPIQIERLEIDRLLQRANAGEEGSPSSRLGWELTRIARSIDDVAEHSAQAIRVDHDRGQVLLLGKGIPAEALPRRPDLLQARLGGHAVVAPMLSMTRLQAAYRQVAGHGPGGSAPPADPPAA